MTMKLLSILLPLMAFCYAENGHAFHNVVT